MCKGTHEMCTCEQPIVYSAHMPPAAAASTPEQSASPPPALAADASVSNTPAVLEPAILAPGPAAVRFQTPAAPRPAPPTLPAPFAVPPRVDPRPPLQGQLRISGESIQEVLGFGFGATAQDAVEALIYCRNDLYNTRMLLFGELRGSPVWCEGNEHVEVYQDYQRLGECPRCQRDGVLFNVQDRRIHTTVRHKAHHPPSRIVHN